MDLLASFELDSSSGLPVWIQIKNRLAYLIATGAYRTGERLPTVRALAVSLDISYNTVNRAYMDLEREGYISTHAGRGTFVSGQSTKAMPSANDSVLALADEMLKAATQAGMSEVDILELVHRRMEERKSGNEPKVLGGRSIDDGRKTIAATRSTSKLIALKKPVPKTKGDASHSA